MVTRSHFSTFAVGTNISLGSITGMVYYSRGYIISRISHTFFVNDQLLGPTLCDSFMEGQAHTASFQEELDITSELCCIVVDFGYVFVD